MTALAGALAAVTADRVTPQLPNVQVPRHWAAWFLAIPLVWKLAGASTLVVGGVTGAALLVRGDAARDSAMLVITGIALVTSLFVNISLVLIALRPLRELEETAERVSRGDLDARVSASPLADRNMARVGRTFNRVLDELIADRARTRRLATEVILEGDRQRSAISRELHDSAAQSLAALMLEVAAASRITTDLELTARLATVRVYAVEILNEVRLLAQRVHPRVLDDLGLAAAIERLARVAHEASDVRIDVDVDLHAARVPAIVASTLYRVAEEAIANAVCHGSPRHVSVRLVADNDSVRLAVTDDGRGFDVAARMANHPGVGLFTMRQRVSLAGGIFEMESWSGAGTVVSAIIPLRTSVNLDAG